MARHAPCSGCPSTILAAAALSLGACVEESRESVSDFKVLQSFTVKDMEGNSRTFRKGDQGSYEWNIILGSDNEGRRGIVLQKSDQSVSIPFALGSDSEYFRLDSSHDVSASESGQGIALDFSYNGSSDMSSAPRTSIESCTITSSERVCERQANGSEKCVDRTVTRTGQREVTRRNTGSYDRRVLTLKNSKKQVLAEIEYSVDNTSTETSNGICY